RGNEILVGAPNGQGPSADTQGAVYDFVQDDVAWTSRSKLSSSNGAAGDSFGSSVAFDIDTVVIGAPRHDGSAGVDQGSAYVFVRNGTNWAEQAELIASDARASDLFGYSVAVRGNTTVVGARNHDGSATDQGATYVFVRYGTNWRQESAL